MTPFWKFDLTLYEIYPSILIITIKYFAQYVMPFDLKPLILEISVNSFILLILIIFSLNFDKRSEWEQKYISKWNENDWKQAK